MIKLNEHPEVVIYADGACKGNPGPGGWGFAILTAGNPEKLLCSGHGWNRDTTNNRMEMTGFLMACEQLEKGICVELWLDSQYVLKGTFEWLPGWRKRNWKTAKGEPVKNEDLWRSVVESAQGLHFDPHWVKGHAGHKWNEYVDRLASDAVANTSRSAHGFDIKHR